MSLCLFAAPLLVDLTPPPSWAGTTHTQLTSDTEVSPLTMAHVHKEL